MLYYVYKVVNKLNGKIYIGKRKNSKPYEDSYMGSGKLIKAAILKYGTENFSKEILCIFDSHEEAAKLESLLVDKEFVDRKDTYNLHEGGLGGFHHINDSSQKHKDRARKGGLSNGGGTKHWTEESYEKVRARGKLNHELGLTSGWHHTDKTKLKFSLQKLGEGNPQYGYKVYINPLTKEKIRIKDTFPPEGFIEIRIYEENLLVNSKRRWFNNGVKSFLMSKEDGILKGLTKGRIIPLTPGN